MAMRPEITNGVIHFIQPYLGKQFAVHGPSLQVFGGCGCVEFHTSAHRQVPSP